MDKLLQQLTAPVSVSGREEAVAKVIETLAAPFGEIRQDGLGNLIVHRPGPGKRVLAAAHMDTVGLMVTYVDEKGFARFAPLGGMHPEKALSQRVRFENGAVGVICYERGADLKNLKPNDLYLDTAGQPVRVGDVASWASPPCFVGGKVISSFLDDRLGCAVCLRALELLGPTDNDVYVVFTVQEEVGRRGAGPAAYAVDPALAIAVDVCGIPDCPGEDAPNDLTLSGGPVVKHMDARILCHPDAVALLDRVGARLDIRTQPYVAEHGGTDAGSIFTVRGGVPTGVLCIPIRYTHTPNEIADLSVAGDCARLLAAALAE